MAASSKAQLLNEIQTLLAKRYALESRPGKLSVLEAIIYAICHEGATREQANQAMSRLADQFFDWNEIRVSGVQEIEDTLAGLPDPGSKAKRLRKFLRQLFSRTYKFDLDTLLKKPLKESIKQLQEYESLKSDYVLASVVQLSLAGHAMPVDAPLRRCLTRLDVIKPNADDATVRSTLERGIAKTRGAEFIDLIAELAHDTCVQGEPDCPRCILLKICVTGKERVAAAKAAEAAKAKALKAKAKTAPAPAPTPAPTPAKQAAPSAKQAPAPPAKSSASRKSPRPK